MSLEDSKKQFTSLEKCSHGGTNRAVALSPERRKEIATKASHSRKIYQGIPRATHLGKLNFGHVEIACAVLEDGRSVITESSIFKMFGKMRGGRKNVQGAQMPRFLSANNLQEYIPDTLRGGAESFDFLLPNGSMAHAYEAEKIPQILKVYLNARSAGKLTASQTALATTAEVIIIALAQTGIVSLIHECTGYQKERESSELQRLFSRFITKELQPWVKRFPNEFFGNLKRIYGIDEMKRTPSFFGTLINKWIYKELSPEIHDELRRLNPVLESGRRKHCHHQLLTHEVGCPALHKQILKVTTLLSVSDTKEDFAILLEKSKH